MDVSEALDRVRKASKSIADLVVINKENYIIRSSSGDIGKQMTGLIQVVEKCRASFKENDELTFLKIKTKKCEYLVVPDREYMLVAILTNDNEE